MINIYVTNAFSKNNRGGNKAGIILDSSLLDKVSKLKIAQKLGFSETVFLSPSKIGDFKLEYFTPTDEVPLCGHATIAAFITMKELHMLKTADYTIETGSGLLRITMEEDGRVFMEQNNPSFFDILDKATLKDCFDTSFIHKHYPIQIVSTGLKDILVPIDTPSHLDQLAVNLKAIAKLTKDQNTVGIHAFSLVDSNGITAIGRNFAPLYGIDEEAATGTSNCALACYLFRQGLKQKEYIFEQGHNLGEVSEICVKIESKTGTIGQVSVGGRGYLANKYQFAIDEVKSLK